MHTSPTTETGSSLPAITPPQAGVPRRLPGRARPRTDILREYLDLNAKRRERIPSILWAFWAPDPDKFYRWRIQLDCDCVTEVLTYGDNNLPDQARWHDHVNENSLPVGQILCSHDDTPPQPYRDITDWGTRREVSFPADPVDPPEGEDSESWALIRRDERCTKAFWKVTLSCGHATDVVTDLDWKPEDGPHRVSPERLQEMTADFEEFWASDPDRQDEREREHYKRMLAQGWPRPQPEELCYTCPRARYIVAYQRIGWLLPRERKPEPPAPPSRASLQRRLQKAEAEAALLRDQLTEFDAQNAPPE
ncbi:hypothetical protein OG589_32695 [Sphaerisporangium sp. NBC_01403]|uniref:hypothetical protein n=1 Tax=Sphaerisporangium sp. NBC_01403 TaxID=2903599 RepID=UPI00324C4D98